MDSDSRLFAELDKSSVHKLLQMEVFIFDCMFFFTFLYLFVYLIGRQI